MPTATDPRPGAYGITRRTSLQRLGLTALATLSGNIWLTAQAGALRASAARHGANGQHFAACWDDPSGAHHAGWLQLDGRGVVSVRHAVELPTRGHGLAVLPDRSLLVAARRPGDWLLHIAPGKKPQWLWQEAGRVFSGHVHVAADGRTVYTTEINTDSGQGLLGVRDARSLQKRAEFASHGLAPHAVTEFPSLMSRINGQSPAAMAASASGSASTHAFVGASARVSDWSQAGLLFVANGGIDTAVETGRVKRHLAQMDSSIACLHPATGELLGQWRLPDPRLSLRHLAWAMPDATDAATSGPRLGIALQAEHDDPAQKTAAPLLAVLDWAGLPEGELRLAHGQPALSGYGGDVTLAGQGNTARFVVSATRGHQLAHFDLTGQFLATTPLADAGALARGGSVVWAAGRGGMLSLPESSPSDPGLPAASGVRPWPGSKVDNHWLRV